MTNIEVEFQKVNSLPQGNDIKTNRLYFLNIGNNKFDFYIANQMGTALSKIEPQSLANSLQSIQEGTGISIDNTDPLNPIINATGGGSGAVDSVNGQTGVVVLDKDDIGLSNVLDVEQYPASNPSNFETPSELDSRDTANRDRANHTGTQPANTISDFDTEVSNNADVTANSAKRSYPISDENKLAGIEDNATADKTPSEIKTAYESNSDTNAFTNSEKSKLANQSGNNTGDETTSTIQSKRPLKTIEGKSIEGGGDINISKADVGLSNVDNTSDTDKPISTATQTALNDKENKAKAEYTTSSGTINLDVSNNVKDYYVSPSGSDNLIIKLTKQ